MTDLVLDFVAAFHFLRPAWLLGLVPLILLVVYQWRKKSAVRQWRQVIAPHILPALVVARGQRVWRGPAGFLLLAASLCFLALAGPAWYKQPSPFAQDKAPLYIALDLSASMAQTDIQPSRFQRARQKIADLLAARGDANAALLVFAGSAHTVVPVTDDPAVLLHFLDAVSVGMLPRQGKQPEQVLTLLDSVSPEEAATLVLVTDGATDTSSSRFHAYFSGHNVQLIVWGVGMDQAALTRAGMPSGLVPRQDTQLQAVTDAANGLFVPFTVDDADIRRVLGRVERHYIMSENNNSPWVDAGYWLVFPLMLVILLWFRRGWTLQW